MINVDQIRVMLQRVILAEVSLDEFDEWISRESWNMHKDSSIEAIELIGKIELILADFDSGACSEAGVIKAFASLNPVFRISNVENPVSITTSGSAFNLVNLPKQQWEVFGTQSVTVFS
jgi:hypothetical protein